MKELKMIAKSVWGDVMSIVFLHNFECTKNITYVMLCAICNHLYNLRNVKNTKSRKASHIQMLNDKSPRIEGKPQSFSHHSLNKEFI